MFKKIAMQTLFAITGLLTIYSEYTGKFQIPSTGNGFR